MSQAESENLIYTSAHFLVERHPQPFVSREEGGHIRIFPKDKSRSCINDLAPQEAIDLIRLEMIVREALIVGMNKRGVPVIWVNLEDLGNWAFKRKERPLLHIHVFGRVEGSKSQVWPEAPYLPDRSSGFYEGFEPLSDDDMDVIRTEIERLVVDERYADDVWNVPRNGTSF